MAQQAKKQIANAVSATVAADVTHGTFLSLTGKQLGKVKVAPVMTSQQAADYERGYALGLADVEHSQGIVDALVECNSPARRIMLRHGYVAAYQSAPRIIRKREVWPDAKQAQNAFDHLAKKHSPDTSRKAKSNATKKATKKKPGRKEKVAFTATKGGIDDGKMISLVVAYCRSVQKEADKVDHDPVEMAADILRILRAGK